MNTLSNTPMNKNSQPQGKCEVRESHIGEWMNRLDKSIAENQEVARHLDQKFTLILRAHPPANAIGSGQQDAPQEYLVELADRIRLLTETVRASTAILESVRDRAEL